MTSWLKKASPFIVGSLIGAFLGTALADWWGF